MTEGVCCLNLQHQRISQTSMSHVASIAELCLLLGPSQVLGLLLDTEVGSDFLQTTLHKKKGRKKERKTNKLCGLSPRANYTDQVTAACQ
jgi:hypothetical protein